MISLTLENFRKLSRKGNLIPIFKEVDLDYDNPLSILKKISDKDLVLGFPDAIHVPSNVTGKNTNSVFNKLIEYLSQRAKKAIAN